MSSSRQIYSTVLGEDFPDDMTIILGSEKLVYKKRQWVIDGETKGLRYGENPDQPAALYQLAEGEITCGGVVYKSAAQSLVSSISAAQMLQAGKHPGKINLTDVDNGINILQYLAKKPACVILKHNNPCGAAWVSKENGGIGGAIEKAFFSDRIASFGGVIVINSPLPPESAKLINDNYFEVIAAPAFEEGAVDILKRRKNLRILELPGLASLEDFHKSAFLDIKSLSDGGIIIQKSFQNKILDSTDFKPAVAKNNDGTEVIAKRPDKNELEDLQFAWAVEAGVTSNSIIFAKNGVTVAIGTAEQDRVGCVDLAIKKAYTKYADILSFTELGLSLYELRQKSLSSPQMLQKLQEIEDKTKAAKGGLSGSVMVSDGFFPFRDGVDLAIAEGIAAIAQPGGSIRDSDSIMACNEAIPQVAMVFTAQRSFKH